MKSRQTNVPALAAAKAGFSTATAYRIEPSDRLRLCIFFRTPSR